MAKQKRKFMVGDRVSPKIMKRPYGCKYSGSPDIWIQPGMIGVIGAVDVPAVRGRGTFNCVDFEIASQKWRCSFDSDELILVEGK